MKNRLTKIIGVSAAFTLVTSITQANAAHAYSLYLNGCAWSTGTLRIDERDVQPHAAYLNSLHAAAYDYNHNTANLALSNVYVTGPALVATFANDASANWEAITYRYCPFGLGITSATFKLNVAHLPSSTAALQLKVVWEHELGHSLGLDHVPQNTHVMYSYASAAYLNGVTGLTQDEINGINFLY